MSRAVRRLTIPIGFALLAVAAMMLVDLSRPDPVMATIVDEKLVGSGGRWGAEVEWVADDGTPRSGFVGLPEEYLGSDEVPLIVHEDGSLEVSEGGFGPLTYLGAGIIAFGLGLTVDLSLRGFGYVRGTDPLSSQARSTRTPTHSMRGTDRLSSQARSTRTPAHSIVARTCFGLP